MADKRAVDFIKAHLAKGYSENQIQNALKSENWPDKVVNGAMTEALKDFHPANKKSTPSGNVPGLVKVLAILNYISALILFATGALFIFGGSILSLVIGSYAGLITSVLMIPIAIFSLALAVLNFFIGRGLWKGQKWARIISIIFAALSMGSAVPSIALGSYISGGSSLAVGSLIFFYLLFSKKVKEAFV